MISYIRGILAAYSENGAIIEVAGIGISCAMVMPSVPIGSPITVYIEWIWSADNGPQLYGFATDAERQLFSLVRNCQGIGGKGALSLLSTLGVQQLAHAIVDRRIDDLCKAPGVGRKRAELVVAQLCDVVTKRFEEFCVSNGNVSIVKSVGQALSGLGYSAQEVQRGLSLITSAELTSVEQGIRAALKALVPPSSR